MVSSEMNPVLRHQKLRGLKRQQRTGQAVPQVDDGIHADAPNVRDDGFKGRQISVNVGDDGNAHGMALAGQLFKVLAEPLTMSLNLRPHLIRRRAAQNVARIERAAQIQHLVHILLNTRIELLQHRKRQFR